MGGRRGVFAGFVGLVVVAGGVLSGCSSGAQGAPGPDVGARVSSSAPAVSVGASPSATATVLLDGFARERVPRAARAHSPQGAEAFARFYLEQVNKAWMVPDPEQIRPYALASCKTCANYVATAEWLVSSDAAYDGAPAALGASVVLPESGADRVLVRVLETQESRRIVDGDGAVADSVPRSTGELEVELLWRQRSWLVRAVKGVRS